MAATPKQSLSTAVHTARPKLNEPPLTGSVLAVRIGGMVARADVVVENFCVVVDVCVPKV